MSDKMSALKKRAFISFGGPPSVASRERVRIFDSSPPLIADPSADSKPRGVLHLISGKRPGFMRSTWAPVSIKTLSFFVVLSGVQISRQSCRASF